VIFILSWQANQVLAPRRNLGGLTFMIFGSGPSPKLGRPDIIIWSGSLSPGAGLDYLVSCSCGSGLELCKYLALPSGRIWDFGTRTSPTPNTMVVMGPAAPGAPQRGRGPRPAKTAIALPLFGAGIRPRDSDPQCQRAPGGSSREGTSAQRRLSLRGVQVPSLARLLVGGACSRSGKHD
jgi:hypothetical protein